MTKDFKFVSNEFREVVRENKNSRSNPLTSVVYLLRILFDPARFIKLFDPLVWRIVLSYMFNPPGLTLREKIGRFLNFTIKSLIFFVVAVLIYRMNNRNMVERKRFLLDLFPIPMNSIGPKNDTVEEALVSSHIHRLVISLLPPPKNPPSIVIRNWGRMRTESTLLRLWNKCKNTYNKWEKAVAYFLGEGEGYPKKTYFKFLSDILAERRSARIERKMKLEKEIKRGEEDNYGVSIFFLGRMAREQQRRFASDFPVGWSKLELGSTPRERSTRDQKLLKKEDSFSVIRRSESIDIVKLFKIMLYLHNNVSIRCRLGEKEKRDKTVKKKKKKKKGIIVLKMSYNEILSKRIEYLDKLNLKLEKKLDKLLLTENRLIRAAVNQYRAIRNRPNNTNNKINNTNNKIMEAVNQYRAIRNRIELQSRPIRNVLNRFFLLNRSDRNLELNEDLEENENVNHAKKIDEKKIDDKKIDEKTEEDDKKILPKFDDDEEEEDDDEEDHDEEDDKKKDDKKIDEKKIDEKKIAEKTEEDDEEDHDEEDDKKKDDKKIDEKKIAEKTEEDDKKIDRKKGDEIEQDPRNQRIPIPMKERFRRCLDCCHFKCYLWFYKLAIRAGKHCLSEQKKKKSLFKSLFQNLFMFSSLLLPNLKKFKPFVLDDEPCQEISTDMIYYSNLVESVENKDIEKSDLSVSLKHLMSLEKDLMSCDDIYEEKHFEYYSQAFPEIFTPVPEPGRPPATKIPEYTDEKFSLMHEDDPDSYEEVGAAAGEFAAVIERPPEPLHQIEARICAAAETELDKNLSSFIKPNKIGITRHFEEEIKDKIKLTYLDKDSGTFLDQPYTIIKSNDFSSSFEDPYSWLNPVKPFHRSSLISSFYKANRLRFRNNHSHDVLFDFSLFYVEKAPLNNYDFLYRQFLNTLFIRTKKVSLGIGQKKHAFWEKDILSAIADFWERSILSAMESAVSKIFISKYFPQSGDVMDNFSKVFPSALARFFSDDRPLIVDISGTPLTDESIVNLEGPYCPPLSDLNQADFAGANLPKAYFPDIPRSPDFHLWRLMKKSNLKLKRSDLLNWDMTNLLASFSDLTAQANSEGANFPKSLDDLIKWVASSDMNRADSKDIHSKDIQRFDFEGTNLPKSPIKLPQLHLKLKRDELTDVMVSLVRMYGVDFDGKKLDESLSDLELYDSEGKKLDESFSDLELYDSEGKTLDESLSDRELDDSEGKNLDESLSTSKGAGSEGKNLDESLSTSKGAGSEGKNLDESLFDRELDDFDVNFDNLDFFDEGTNFEESLSDLNLVDLKRTPFDKYLSNMKLVDSKGTNLDESLLDLDLDLDRDLHSSEEDFLKREEDALKSLLGESFFKREDDALKSLLGESFFNSNLADSEETNLDESPSNSNGADSEGKKLDESPSNSNGADSEGKKLDESLSDRELDDSEGKTLDESLSDRELDDSEGKNLDESLSNRELDDLVDLFDSEATNLDPGMTCLELSNLKSPLILSLNLNSKSLNSNNLNSNNLNSNNLNSNNLNSQNLGIPSSSFKKYLVLELEKRKKDRRNRNKNLLRQEKIRHLYLTLCYKKIKMDRNKSLDNRDSSFSTRSKENIFQKYLQKYLFQKYLQQVQKYLQQVQKYLQQYIPKYIPKYLSKAKRTLLKNPNWRIFTRYLPWALTSTGFRYLIFFFFDIVSYLRQRIWNRQRWQIRVLEIQLGLFRWTRKSKKWMKSKQNWQTKFKKCEMLLKKCVLALKKFDENFLRLSLRLPFLLNFIKTNWENSVVELRMKAFRREQENESPTDRNIKNFRELLVLIDLFLLVIVYLFCIALLHFFYMFDSLFKNFKMAKSLIMDGSMIEIELQELLAEYPPSEPPDFLLSIQNFFVGLLQNMLLPSGKKKRKFLNINLSRIIHPISFAIKTRYISHTSKEIYSFIIKRKKMKAYWNQPAYWIAKSEWVEDQERDVLMQFAAFRRTRGISEILWSLTHHDDHLSKDGVIPALIEQLEQPGEVYLRKVVDFHKKGLLNYEFNTSSLVEKRIFLALYQTIADSKTSSGVDPFPVLSGQKPFSLRLNLAPSKSILLIGSIGFGRSFLVNSLAKNSYLPFMTIFLDKFRGTIFRALDDDELEGEDSDFQIEIFIDSRDDIGMLSEDIQTLNPFDSFAWDRLLDHLNKCTNPFYNDDLYLALDHISMVYDQTDDMDMVPDVVPFYISLQIELAKAMSPCIIWIPNIHELDLADSNFLSLGLLAHLLSWDSERSSTSNNLVIASTHMPKKMHPALIDTQRFNTCIKVRRPLISQQQKNFYTLSYNRGFRLESQVFQTTRGFESINLGSNVQDLVSLTHEARSLSLSQGKSIIDSNTIRRALHRQTWDLRARPSPINNSRVLFYQIGRVVAQYLLLRDCPIDPISIYMNKRFCKEREPYVYRWYYQLGMSMKKLTILLYVLNCSAGLVAQDLWSRSGLDANNGIASGSLVEDNSELVHSLLEIEGVLDELVPTEKDCSRFDKDRMPVLRRPEPRNPSDMIQNGFWSMIDQRLVYQQDLSAPPIVVNGAPMDLHQMFDNYVVWSPRVWSPWAFLLDWIKKVNAIELGFAVWDSPLFAKQIQAILFNYDEDDLNYDEDDLKENEQENESHSDEDEGEQNPDPLDEKEKKKEKSTFYKLEDEYNDGVEPEFVPILPEDDALAEAFLQSIYETRARIRSCQEQIFLRGSRFIWDPGNPFFSLSDEPYVVAMLASHELFPDEDVAEEKWFFTAEIKSLKKSLFVLKAQEKHYEWFIRRHRCLLRPKNLLSKGSFRSNSLFESYQYLSNLFLSNRTVVNQMQKLLLRKRWLFPDDMQYFLNEQYHPVETRKN